MGCDIHIFVEYRKDGAWRQLGHFHPGRDYRAFGALAGVRDQSIAAVVKPRGFPHDASFETWLANQSIRVEGKEELDREALARLQIGRIVGADVSHIASPCLDWHTHSWLDADELGEVLKLLGKRKNVPARSWRALHALLAALPEGRMVFFFDN